MNQTSPRSLDGHDHSAPDPWKIEYDQSSDSLAKRSTMHPRIPLDLSAHKLSIALHWIPIILSCCILPIALYFILHYTTTLALNIVLTVPLVIMGVVSLATLVQRTIRLLGANSACRPRGAAAARVPFDWFHWNFVFFWLALTVLISVGIALKSRAVVALPASVVVLFVAAQLLLVELAIAFDVRVPWRISSIAPGEMLRPGVFVIAEDVVAVDGGLGAGFRAAWGARYEADADFRALLRKMDWIWGSSGLVVVAVVWGLVFGLENKEIGFAVGWALPWTWAGCLTLLTIFMAKNMLKKQRSRAGQYESL